MNNPGNCMLVLEYVDKHCLSVPIKHKSGSLKRGYAYVHACVLCFQASKVEHHKLCDDKLPHNSNLNL